MGYNKNKHDIGIVTQGGTAIGMMLATKNAVPIYSVSDDEYLAQQMFTGVAGYGSLPPEKEIAMRQDDWRSGFGLEVYDSAEPKRYFKTINMDMRFRGMGILGSKATAVIKPAVTAVTATFRPDADIYAGFASSTGASHYTEVDETTADDETTRVYFSGSEGIHADTDRYGIPDHTAESGTIAKIIVHIRFRSSGNYTAYNYGRPIIKTHGTVYYGDLLKEFDGDWRSHSHEWTVNPHTGVVWTWQEIDDLEIGGLVCAGDSAGSYSGAMTQVYMIVTYTPTTASMIFCDYNDELYMAVHTYLTKLNATGAEFTNVNTNLGAIITDLETFTDDNLYIALGHATNYFRMNISEVFTKSTLANNKPKFMKTVHTTTPTMYGSDSDNTIRSTTNPASVAWSNATTIGSSYHIIQELFSKSGALYIRKEDMPYYLDSTGAVQNDLAPELENIESKAGDKNVDIWLGNIYMPSGAALLEHDVDGVNSWLSPSLWCTDLSEFDGDIQATAHDEQWEFVAINDGSNTQILAGRRETIDGSTIWVWHPIAKLALISVGTMYVSSVYEKRLYVASTDASADLYYFKLYRNYGDVTNDTNRYFQTDGYFHTPYLHGNFRGDDKAYIKLIAELGHTYDANVNFAVSYQLFGNASWSNIGTFAGSNTSMIDTQYINVSNEPSGTMIRFNFMGQTNNTSLTPILKGYDCRAILYPTRRDIIVCRVRCADNILDKDGNQLDADAATIKATLEEAKNDATWPVTFYDIDGTTKYVRFLSASPFSQVIRDEKSRNIERRFNLVLQEVSLE